MSVDPGILYRTCRERITALVRAPDVDETMAVPATPGWCVHDVISHLSGVSEDAITNNMAGAPGEAWTAAQVARGKGKSLDELFAQWAANSAMLEGFFSSPAGAASGAGVYDAHTHEADLRNALGLPAAVPADFLTWAAPGFRESFAQAVADAGLPPVTMEASDFEWFRARLGRRSEAEVRAYAWTADPTPYLDHFFIFGRAVRSIGERE